MAAVHRFEVTVTDMPLGAWADEYGIEYKAAAKDFKEFVESNLQAWLHQQLESQGYSVDVQAAVSSEGTISIGGFDRLSEVNTYAGERGLTPEQAVNELVNRGLSHSY